MRTRRGIKTKKPATLFFLDRPVKRLSGMRFPARLVVILHDDIGS